MLRLSLSLLGPFQVFLDGRPLTSFESSKVRALLAFLAVEGGRPHPRDVLAGMLWPERTNSDALANLRYALYDLRNVIADREAVPGFLLINRSSIQLNPQSDYYLDVAHFKRLTEDLAHPHPDNGAENRDEHCRRLCSAVDLWQGPFLEGFSVSGSPQFEEWSLLRRENLCHRMGRALQNLVAAHEERREFDQAIRWARRQIELEPWDERTHRKLIRLLMRTGQRGAAMRQYETCRRTLRQSFGIEPTERTRMLFERIRN